MINILEKDGAVIITIENPTSREKSLISEAKKLNDPKMNEEISRVFGKFKCNQNKQPDNSCGVETKKQDKISDEFLNLDDFVAIGDPGDLPF